MPVSLIGPKTAARSRDTHAKGVVCAGTLKFHFIALSSWITSHLTGNTNSTPNHHPLHKDGMVGEHIALKLVVKVSIEACYQPYRRDNSSYQRNKHGLVKR